MLIGCNGKAEGSPLPGVPAEEEAILGGGSDEGQEVADAAEEDKIVHNVSYEERSWNGSAVISETKTLDAVAVPSDGGMTSGWYYLNSNVTKTHV